MVHRMIDFHPRINQMYTMEWLFAILKILKVNEFQFGHGIPKKGGGHFQSWFWSFLASEGPQKHLKSAPDIFRSQNIIYYTILEALRLRIIDINRCINRM